MVITEVFNLFWQFAAERQSIFHRRTRGEPYPWTLDPILSTYKFTNAYRASDRTSQYLIRRVIYRDDLPSTPDELFFRIILFKLFNRISTWELLESTLGTVSWELFSFELYDSILMDALARHQPIYSSAYIMPPGIQWGHRAKHRNHLQLLRAMIKDELPHQLTRVSNMQQAFELLKSYPSIGDFLAYQLVIDINYSELVDFPENEFVVPGPGALSGIKKCFADYGGLTPTELIRLVTDRQDEEFPRLDIEFESLWGRRLQLIDCQNLFCEIDKYTRVSHPDIRGTSSRKRIKHHFRPNDSYLSVWYPPKWGINQRLPQEDINPFQERLL